VKRRGLPRSASYCICLEMGEEDVIHPRNQSGYRNYGLIGGQIMPEP